MSSIRIPLAFHTAVHGYSWHCKNVWFSEADYALIEERFFADNDVGVHPIACVFTCGDRVFFSRHLKAENYDFDMRSADYYVAGVVRKHDVKHLDFKWIFENELFVTPIRRELAMSEKFPAYLDYEGGQATDGTTPSENHPEQVDAKILSSIGSWIEDEAGDIVVYIANDMAKPTVEVKVKRKFDTSGGASGSGGFKELSPAACKMLETQEKLNGIGVPAGDPSRNTEKPSEGVLSKIGRLIGRIFGFGRSGRTPCPYCQGTGWVNDSSQSQLKGLKK